MADNTVLSPDLCIIGGGLAGYTLALASVALGLSCVVVDKGTVLGRSQAADLALDMLIAAGRSAGPRRADADPDASERAFAELRIRIGRAISVTAPNTSAERLRAAGVTVLQAAARFTSPTALSAGGLSIRAHRFVVATGARPHIPRLDGIDLIRPLTLDSLAGLARLPHELAVLGETPAAFELAQAFRRLGSTVTLIGAPAAGGSLDPELRGRVLDGLRRDGVVLRLETTILRLQPRDAAIEAMLAGDAPETVTVSHLLIAAGRTPYAESLGLDRAGVRTTKGVPVVGRNLATSNGRVFAMGDILGGTGGAAAIAVQAGLLLRAAFFRQPVSFQPSQVPQVIRTEPPLARVGASEEEGRTRSRAIRILRWSFAENDRALADAQPGGLIKVVATARGQVLGAAILGPQAAELIVPWSMALAHGLSLDDVAAVPIPLPSLAEAPRRAALTFVAGRLKRPWINGLRGLIRRLG